MEQFESAPGGVRRKLDFIYQEVLGEVSELVKRLEAVSTTLQEVSRARVGERTAEALEQSAATAASRIRVELDRTVDAARRRLSATVGELGASAATNESGRQWAFYVASSGIALASSLAGAGIVVLAHMVGWW